MQKRAIKGKKGLLFDYVKRFLPSPVKLFLYPFYMNFMERDELKRVMDLLKFDIDLPSLSDNSKTIVFNTVQLTPNPGSLAEIILAMRLRQRGHRAIVLYDDGVLHHCDRVTMPGDKAAFACRRCRHLSRKMVRRARRGVEFVPYSSLIDRKELLEIAAKYREDDSPIYQGIDLKPYIRASVIRFLHDGVFALDERTRWFYEASIDNAFISAEVASTVERLFHPDTVMSVHTVYSSWGPFMRYFRDSGVPCVTWNKGQTDFDTLFFTRYIDTEILDTRRAWELRRWRPLTDKERFRLDSYMHKRFQQQIGFTKFLRKTADGTAMSAGPVEGRPTFALFPNVLWDSSLTDCDVLFENVVEWLAETTRWFINHPDYGLIIRAHPAEAQHMISSRSVRQILESYVGDLSQYRNIRYIEPEAILTSYELFPYIEGGIVYNGTIGLELAYAGKPVILGGKPTYNERVGIAMPLDREAYFNAFTNLEELRARQASNYPQLLQFMYICTSSSVKYRCHSYRKKSGGRLIWIRLSGFCADPDPVVDHICACLEDPGRELSQWRSAIHGAVDET